MSTYAVIIEDAGPNYSAYVPDLPGCVSVGLTVEEVTTNIHDAIEIHIAALVEFVRTRTYKPFAWYRIAIAILVAAVYLSRHG